MKEPAWCGRCSQLLQRSRCLPTQFFLLETSSVHSEREATDHVSALNFFMMMSIHGKEVWTFTYTLAVLHIWTLLCSLVLACLMPHMMGYALSIQCCSMYRGKCSICGSAFVFADKKRLFPFSLNCSVHISMYPLFDPLHVWEECLLHQSVCMEWRCGWTPPTSITRQGEVLKGPQYVVEFLLSP